MLFSFLVLFFIQFIIWSNSSLIILDILFISILSILSWFGFNNSSNFLLFFKFKAECVEFSLFNILLNIIYLI